MQIGRGAQRAGAGRWLEVAFHQQSDGPRAVRGRLLFGKSGRACRNCGLTFVIHGISVINACVQLPNASGIRANAAGILTNAGGILPTAGGNLTIADCLRPIAFGHRSKAFGIRPKQSGKQHAHSGFQRLHTGRRRVRPSSQKRQSKRHAAQIWDWQRQSCRVPA